MEVSVEEERRRGGSKQSKGSAADSSWLEGTNVNNVKRVRAPHIAYMCLICLLMKQTFKSSTDFILI